MAESIYIRGEGGSIIKMDLPLPEAIEGRLLRGHLHRVNENGDPYTGEPPVRPAVNAVKAEWVGWAVFNGAEPDAAEGATKQDLIEKYGTQPVSESEQSAEAEQPAENIPAGDGTEQGGDQPPVQ